MSPTTPSSSHPYNSLTPDAVLDAVESTGVVCDGRLLALNSYENRVYQVGIEGEQPKVVKFYRPGRWSTDAILEEHAYTLELAQAEIPVVPPVVWSDGKTLHESHGFRFAIYERKGGHWPELDNEDNLEWLGRFIARIHALGAREPFKHRPRIDIKSYGYDNADYLLSERIVPPELHVPYKSLIDDVLKEVSACFERAGRVKTLRLHGDCHPGNILWTDSGPHFVDFDDARSGPAVQDLWMLLSGDRQDMTRQLAVVLEGYTQFYDFDPLELNLIEALRTLRMINYSAWLARRWDDPSFPINFPWFGSPRYWEEQILSLREQLALMQEAPLQWY